MNNGVNLYERCPPGLRRRTDHIDWLRKLALGGRNLFLARLGGSPTTEA